MLNLVLCKSKSFYNSFSSDTKWIIKTPSWGLSFNDPSLINDERKQLVKIGFHRFELKNKSPKFIPINELIPKFCSCSTANFKSKTNKSSIVKVYIDSDYYITRTSGRLKIKNKSFKTNLKWLSQALSDAGLTDVTPGDWINK